MKKKFKIEYVILIVSIIGASIIFLCGGNNVLDIQNSILSLFINLIASIIIIILINNRNERAIAEERLKKCQESYKLLIDRIKDFKYFIVNIYRATKKEISYEDFIYDAIEWARYDNYKNIELLNNNKEGYVTLINGEMYPWKLLIIDEINKYLNNVEKYSMTFIDILPHNIYRELNILCGIYARQNKIDRIIVKKCNVSTKDLYVITNIKDIMDATYSLLSILKEDICIKKLEFSKDSKIRNDISPSFGSGL